MPKCSSCDAARVYLKKRGVPFTEVNVSEKNPQAQQEMVKKFGELVAAKSGGKITVKEYPSSQLNM